MRKTFLFSVFSLSLFLIAFDAVAYFTGPVLTAEMLNDGAPLRNSKRTHYEGGIFPTKKLYNGTFPNTYVDVMAACEQEKAGSIPCTDATLMAAKFWLNQIWPPWWVNGPQVNCVGWTSDDQNTIGMCVQTKYGVQEIPCSCNMAIAICCHMPTASSPLVGQKN